MWDSLPLKGGMGGSHCSEGGMGGSHCSEGEMGGSHCSEGGMGDALYQYELRCGPEGQSQWQ